MHLASEKNLCETVSIVRLSVQIHFLLHTQVSEAALDQHQVADSLLQSLQSLSVWIHLQSLLVCK